VIDATIINQLIEYRATSTFQKTAM
jgi:calcium-dependent protein kinase